MGVLQERPNPGHQGATTRKQTKAPARGSTAVSSLDCLLADMESFKTKKEANNNNRGKVVEIEVENKKEEELEKKLDKLTDKLLGALQTGSQTPEEGQEKSDLGKCAACGISIEESAFWPVEKPFTRTASLARIVRVGLVSDSTLL